MKFNLPMASEASYLQSQAGLRKKTAGSHGLSMGFLGSRYMTYQPGVANFQGSLSCQTLKVTVCHIPYIFGV